MIISWNSVVKYKHNYLENFNFATIYNTFSFLLYSINTQIDTWNTWKILQCIFLKSTNLFNSWHLHKQLDCPVHYPERRLKSPSIIYPTFSCYMKFCATCPIQKSMEWMYLADIRASEYTDLLHLIICDHQKSLYL